MGAAFSTQHVKGLVRPAHFFDSEKAAQEAVLLRRMNEAPMARVVPAGTFDEQQLSESKQKEIQAAKDDLGF